MPSISHLDLPVASPANAPFTRQGWIFELKYDGFRVLAGKDRTGAHMVSRRGTNLLPAFPEICRCLEDLPDCVLDGELVVLDDAGRPDFSPLQRRLRVKRPANVASASVAYPAVVFAFDLLELHGKNIRRQPLLKRKAQLESLLKGFERVRYLGYIGENGERLFEAAEKLGLEGIVAKPAESLYLRGRQSGWLKIKTAAARANDAEQAKWNER